LGPVRWVSHDVAETPWSVVWFPGSPWVSCDVVRSPKGSPWDRQPLPSLARSGGVIPGTGCLTPVIWLLVEYVMSRVLGHNRWPMIPRVQDPDSSLLAFPQVGGWSQSLAGWQNRSSHGSFRVTAALENMTVPKASMIKFQNPVVVPPA
jgi:hypothetical protein